MRTPDDADQRPVGGGGIIISGRRGSQEDPKVEAVRPPTRRQPVCRLLQAGQRRRRVDVLPDLAPTAHGVCAVEVGRRERAEE